MDDIQILKQLEQEQYEDAAQMKKDAANSAESPATTRRIQAGIWFIALGLIGLLAMRASEPWNYWWLIFFAKPFLFGFGMRKGHWGHMGWWGWGMCHPHDQRGGNA